MKFMKFVTGLKYFPRQGLGNVKSGKGYSSKKLMGGWEGSRYFFGWVVVICGNVFVWVVASWKNVFVWVVVF